MHTTTLRTVGGSVMLTLPPAVLEQLHLHVGASVTMGVDEGRLVIEPQRRPKYRLEDLLMESQPGTATIADSEWLQSAPVGNELI